MLTVFLRVLSSAYASRLVWASHTTPKGGGLQVVLTSPPTKLSLLLLVSTVGGSFLQAFLASTHNVVPAFITVLYLASIRLGVF